MNLWIRSQDREKIVNCNDIVVNGNSIIGYFDKDTEYEELGTYKSKERALEVLDEIQKLLMPIYQIKSEFKKSELTGNCKWETSQEYVPINNKVYEMPKE